MRTVNYEELDGELGACNEGLAWWMDKFGRDDNRPRQGSRQQLSAKEFARRKRANKVAKNN